MSLLRSSRNILLKNLPEELVLRILTFLDIPDLLATSRTSHQLRTLSLDSVLHTHRLRHSHALVSTLYPLRPHLSTLQPPTSTIYLTAVHNRARILHWSLVRARLNRSLIRRPALSDLVSANILPPECCRLDRRSGEFVWGAGLAGALVEPKRRLEREYLKEGLRALLERKVRRIGARRKESGGGVGVMVWRFSRKLKLGEGRREGDCDRSGRVRDVGLKSDGKVMSLKRFFEGRC
ncbi:uncharacterized protein MYCGRDRAFT_89490 [Zymoseptoria tritici IPO323]|uniref:F-box domain-containing protein n=1 Tax=Zymoseptoria tritici (strain CBS 115943 / IPO323) TaxID=336722 RepID=F9X150_ZYMTI|nr:uncharacterized protein MYCGRDRAFT_89490 [Zymoseptoria tritici IPO323]EGP91327.1 hypothetical protein MYCGRDRAFT_89490 [Zymoseptoria tritici IPO323]